MSSIDFRGLQTSSDDPQARLIKSLERKLARFLTQDQVKAVDSDNEDIYADGQDMESVVKFHSVLPFRLTNYDTNYYPTEEPDNNFNKIWIRGTNTGTTIKDYSGFNHDAHIVGETFIVDGTLALGTYTDLTLSFATRYNTPDVDTEANSYIYFDDHIDLQIGSSKIAEFIRFRPLSTDESLDDAATLIHKFDDNAFDEARRLFISTGGRLIYTVNYNGTNYRRATAFDTIVPRGDGQLPYDVWATFDPALIATNPIKINVNGTNQTLTTPTFTAWDGDETNHTLKLFALDPVDGGFVSGDFYYYKMWKGFIPSDTQMGYHYTNKWTIENIPFGQVAVVDNWDTNNTQLT